MLSQINSIVCGCKSNKQLQLVIKKVRLEWNKKEKDAYSMLRSINQKRPYLHNV